MDKETPLSNEFGPVVQKIYQAGNMYESLGLRDGLKHPGHRSWHDVMEHLFFVSDTDWDQTVNDEIFDYVIIGSSYCAYAFVDRMLELDPRARILLIEAGSFYLPDHLYNLSAPSPEKFIESMQLFESYSWTLSDKTSEGSWVSWLHGASMCFGGRSTLWFGWSPQPTADDMQGWPSRTIEIVQQNVRHADRLLNVVASDDIRHQGPEPGLGQTSMYGVMQDYFIRELNRGVGHIPGIRVEPARFALANAEPHKRHSTPGQLLNLADRQETLCRAGKGSRIRMLANCKVDRILERNGRALALQTSRGEIALGDAKLALAMGTMPATVLVANSFPAESYPDLRNVGERFTAHFASNIIARIPRKCFPICDRLKPWEAAAINLPGQDPETGGSYHVQLLMVSDNAPSDNVKTTFRYVPELALKTSQPQLISSADHIVIACTPKGGMDHQNHDTWFRRNKGYDPAAGYTLQILINDNDQKLWNTMDNAAYDVLEKILLPANTPSSNLEYWRGTPEDGTWQYRRPPPDQVRRSALMHEGSTLWLGGEDEAEAPVDINYRLRSVENVYVTGGGLWPVSGSWNPTATMVALALDLAVHLAELRGFTVGRVSSPIEPFARPRTSYRPGTPPTGFRV